MVNICHKIAGLSQLSPAQLRAEWRQLHRGKSLPDGMSTDLMMRAIASRLQEKAFGSLPPTRVRELERLAKQLETTGELDLERQRQLKPGTRLVRQWHGKPYVVTVLEQGYEFEERHHASLTSIARQITGAAWSGPRFFGLLSKSAKRQ